MFGLRRTEYLPAMRELMSLCLMGMCVGLYAQGDTATIDTVRAIMAIEQRMDEVDMLPIGAVFAKLEGREEAVRLWPDSALPAGEVERYELYVNPDGSVAGMGIYPISTHPGVLESSCHYFDAQGNTVSVWWRMKWQVSGCTDTLAVETRYVYFAPPTNTLLEYATLKDARGNKLDGAACKFPDIERQFDAYYHRDILLIFKGIPEN